MASQQGEDFGYKAGKMAGQAQMKKDEYMNQASNVVNRATENVLSGQNPLASQPTNFLQQTGEQVKNIAQGAADVVKNTLGMSTDITSNNTTSTNHPSNPSTRI